MLNLTDSTILIVGDTPDVSDLRARLIESGATVHVVSVAGASLLVHQKEIDSAFIAANLDKNTQRLCAELDSDCPGVPRTRARSASADVRDWAA